MRSDEPQRRLRQLIGQRFDYLGEVWILLEVLIDDDSVVLTRCHGCKPQVQRDAYGVPNRRVENTLTVPISSQDGESYSDDLLLLLEGRQLN